MQEPHREALDQHQANFPLKTHIAEVVSNLKNGDNPLVINQNAKAKMIIEDIRIYEQKEETLALLKILAMGKKDLIEGKGTSAEDFRKQLAQL